MFKSGEKKSESSLTSLLHAQKEVRIEREGVLPEYCDDIHRIIASEGVICIRRTALQEVESRRVCVVQGTVNVQVVYRGEEQGEGTGLSSHAFSEEFEETFDLPVSELPAPAHILCRYTPTATVARALGKKRCLVSCTFALSVDVFANRALEYYEAPPSGVETLTRTERFSRLKEVREESFELEQEITLPEELDSILDLVASSFTLCVRGTKLENEGITFSADALLLCTYSAETEGDGRLVSFSQPLEFSGEMHLSEASEEDVVSLSLHPQSLKCEVLMDELGVRRSIRLRLGYLAVAALYESAEVLLVTDAYALGAESTPLEGKACLAEVRPQKLCRAEETLSFAAPEPLSALENCRAFVQVLKVEKGEGALEISARVFLSALGVRSEDGRILAVSHSEERTFSCPLPADAAGQTWLCENVHAAVQMKSQEEGVTARLSCTFPLNVRCESETEYLCDLAVAEERAPFCGVRFYYPGPQESLWEIARAHRVSLSSLMEKNAVAEKAPLPHMLMITE